MNKEIVEKVGKGVVYAALAVGTLGKMFFDIKDKDKSITKAVEEYMNKKLNESK